MSKPSRILIVGPSWVGDMMMAHTLFQLIKKHNPQAKIDVMAPAWSHPLLHRMPEVSQAIVLPFSHGELRLRDRYQLGKSLRGEHYDRAFVCPNSLKSALVPFFAKIPKRTGWLGEKRYGLLNDARSLDKSRYPKMVERYAALAFEPDVLLPDSIPLPKLVVTKEDVVSACAKHGVGSTTSSSVLALCPGAEFGPSKQWPESYYADLANKKLDDGWQVWLFGSKNDCPTAAKIQVDTRGRCLDLTGKTTLAEAVDLLSLASVVVTNDSGLMHIATALGRKVVAIYGSTSPDFTPPLGESAVVLQHKINCSPCFKRVCPLGHHQCMQALTPKSVLPYTHRTSRCEI